ncbi:uncharacterized protein LOC111239791, partial [Seriola dumerili]|uniref:uncharacterized protein LOC111239791 n=1 Tax=Seriola dumerili TaxID=41447 RepID=UPI000BBF0592
MLTQQLNYTWYKENEDSPKASGQIFTITDLRPKTLKWGPVYDTCRHLQHKDTSSRNSRVTFTNASILLLTEPGECCYSNVRVHTPEINRGRRRRRRMGLEYSAVRFKQCSSAPVIQGQRGWGVFYTHTHICAFKGSTVEIHCSYSYPSRINGYYTTVEETLWFTKKINDAPLDLRTDSDYRGRVEYNCRIKNSCTLTIRDLRESDSAEYKFRITTNQGGKYTGEPGVTLYFTGPDLQVLVERSSTQTELKCHSSFKVADRPSYVWYKNGLEMKEETFSLRVSVNDDNSYSCALKGHEDSTGSASSV